MTSSIHSLDNNFILANKSKNERKLIFYFFLALPLELNGNL